MQDIITIIKLMEQAPSFSVIFGFGFIFLVVYFVKNEGEKKINEKVNKGVKESLTSFIAEQLTPIIKKVLNVELEPIKNDVITIKEKQKHIEQTICPKNGL